MPTDYPIVTFRLETPLTNAECKAIIVKAPKVFQEMMDMLNEKQTQAIKKTMELLELTEIMEKWE